MRELRRALESEVQIDPPFLELQKSLQALTIAQSRKLRCADLNTFDGEMSDQALRPEST